MSINHKVVKGIFGIFLILLSVSWLFILPFIPLNSDKIIVTDFFSQNKGKYMLLFFGFPGCHTICPPTLKKMGELYTIHQQADYSLEITFVNLLLTANRETATHYAKQFHPNFVTYQPSEQELKELTHQFGVYSYQTSAQPLEHSGYIYLLEKLKNQWVIKTVYTNTQQLATRFSDDFTQLKLIQ